LASTAECLVGCAVNGSHKAAVVCLGVLLLCSSIVLSAMESLVPSMGTPMMVAAFCCAGLGVLAVTVLCVSSAWLATGPDGTPTAEEQDTQKFIKLLPTLFMGSLSFGALYNSMQFWYQQQACQMDVRLGSIQLSGSFFNIADCFAIVLMTPILLDYINPFMEKKMGKLGHGTKFGIGMAVAGISVLVAAKLELMRKGAAVLPIQSNCAPPGVNMSDLQGAWMMVPYFLMGVAEIYTQPTLLHFAYSQSPPSMRTFSMAASFFIQAVSSAIFALLVKALSSYIPNDLNTGHLEFGYYVNLLIGFALFVPFLAVLKMHENAETAQASSSA
jgi:dipeptide/tripeptide permease